MHARRVGLAALRTPASSLGLGTSGQWRQQRGLSELYSRIVKKQPARTGVKEPVETVAKEPVQTVAKKPAPVPLRSSVVSSIPVAKIKSQTAGLARIRSADKPPASSGDPKAVAGEYVSQLHKGSWGSEETWARFCRLPRESLAHLRDIDVNFTLARIRGSARAAGRVSRTVPTTVMLNRMLEVYEATRRAGVVADRYTFQELVTINVGLLNFGHAREWIERMVRQGLVPTIRPYRTLLKGYSMVADEIGSAQEIWREIKSKIAAGMIAPETPGEQAAKLDLLTYTCIVTAESRAGNFDAVIELLGEMDAAGVKADLALRNTILDGILKHRGTDAGLAEARLMEESGFAPDSYTYMLLLGAACGEKRSDDIRSLLGAAAARGVVPSAHIIQRLPFGPFEILGMMSVLPALGKVRLYNVLVEAAMRRNDFGKVVQLSDHMRSNGVAANVVTYTVLLDALNKAGRLDQAKTLFGQLLQGTELTLDTHIFSTMVDACGRHGDIRAMFEFVGEMRRRGLLVTEPIYNSVLSSLSRWRRDNLQAVMAVTRELERSRPPVAPTARTFSAIFAAFVAQAQHRRLGAGELEYLRMWYGYAGSKYYVAKDAYFYFMAVNAFVGAGCLEDAMAAFGDMVRHAELDRSVAGKFAEKPSRLLGLMEMAAEQQEFEMVLGVWDRWQQLRLPPMPAAAKLALFACDQTGRTQTAQDMVRGLLAHPSTDSGSVSGDPPEQRPGQTAEYCPPMVDESVLAMYIAMLIKHGSLDAVVPAMRLWVDAMQATPGLSEKTVSRLVDLLRKSKQPGADQTCNELLTLVDRHFPDAVPL